MLCTSELEKRIKNDVQLYFSPRFSGGMSGTSARAASFLIANIGLPEHSSTHGIKEESLKGLFMDSDGDGKTLERMRRTGYRAGWR